MKQETVKKIGAVVGVIGCIAADVAATAILKHAAPEATNKLNKLIVSAGIGFIGYAAGHFVEAAVRKDTEEFCASMEELTSQLKQEEKQTATVYVVETIITEE